jgi:menaquinone-9 beta-reductase
VTVLETVRQIPILICGAGLAGTACAIKLTQWGHKVVLLDKAKFPRRKLCGEFLGPDAMPILEALGILNAVKEQCQKPIDTIHIYNVHGQALHIKSEWFRKDYPYALALPRAELDDLLLRYAKSLGVEVWESHEVQEYQQFDDGMFELSIQALKHDSDNVIQQTESTFKVRTPILIDASGRNSRLAHLAHRKDEALTAPTVETSVGVQCHVRYKSLNNDLNMFFFPGGYGGLQPISEDLANLCCWMTPKQAQMSRDGLASLLEHTLALNHAAKPLLNSMHTVEPIQRVAGLRKLNRPPSELPFISVGDALLTVEPFSGFGMAHALKSAVIAASCIHENKIADNHYSRIRKEYLRRYQKTFRNHLYRLRVFQPALKSQLIQSILWPGLSPFLPWLTALYR